MRAEDFHGTWELVRWRMISADGTETFPFTDRAVGQFIYGAEGRMAVLLMHPDWARGEAPNGFIGFGGRFVVEGAVVHHLVDYAHTPGLIGSDQIRTAAFAGDMVTLESPVSETGVRQRLEWRRVAA